MSDEATARTSIKHEKLEKFLHEAWGYSLIPLYEPTHAEQWKDLVELFKNMALKIGKAIGEKRSLTFEELTAELDAFKRGIHEGVGNILALEPKEAKFFAGEIEFYDNLRNHWANAYQRLATNNDRGAKTQGPEYAGRK